MGRCWVAKGRATVTFVRAVRRVLQRACALGACSATLSACSSPPHESSQPRELVAATRADLDPTGLVAAYNFDEGEGLLAEDASGNLNTGVLSGTTWSLSGKHGGAAAFDGDGDWITIDDNSTLAELLG